jgi:hypothetical protein
MGFLHVHIFVASIRSYFSCVTIQCQKQIFKEHYSKGYVLSESFEGHVLSSRRLDLPMFKKLKMLWYVQRTGASA